MAIETVYRLRLDFDVNNSKVTETKEQEDKDQESIQKITKFIFNVSQQADLDECETSEGGPAHGPYLVLEHSDRVVLEKASQVICAYIRRFKGHHIQN